MNEEIQSTDPTEDAATESENTEQPTTENTGDAVGAGDSPITTPIEGGNTLPLDVMVTSPIDNREQTIFRTGDGEIHVIHEITLGDVVLSTLIMALLVFMVLEKVIRR